MRGGVSNSVTGQNRGHRHGRRIEVSARAHSETHLESAMQYLGSLSAQLGVAATARAGAVGLSLLVGGALLGLDSQAFATCVPNDDDCAKDVITTVLQVVPAPPIEGTPSAAFSNATLTRNVKYKVELKHYFRTEVFPEVYLQLDTSVLGNTGIGAGPGPIVSWSAPTLGGPTGASLTSSVCTPSLSNTRINCTFVFNPTQPFSLENQTINFDVLVQSPTQGATLSSPTLNVITLTSWKEPGSEGEIESDPTGALTTTTALTTPDPTVAETVLTAPGTVTTGTTQGAATCSQPWVTSVKVPAAAQVGVNLNRVPVIDDDLLPLNAIFFSRIQIPDAAGAPQLFGVGTHWYDPDAKSKLVVNTLRRDKCTIGSGMGTVKDALLILQEKIYYKPDIPYPPRVPEVPPVYKPLHLCLVTSGPYPGEPCIVYAQVYTKFNLPNVPNKLDFLGDHEWVIFSNENGKIAPGK
jgi:hypothetical protein